MFLFRKKKAPAAADKALGDSSKPPLSAKAKSAEEAKKDAFKLEKKESEKLKDPEEKERAPAPDDDEESRRRRASRRISQSQIGKPLSYNAYLTQTKLQQPPNKQEST